MDTADRYFNTQAPKKAVAVISNRKLLEAANQKMADQPLRLHVV
jgi:hypothetical protein